VLAEQERRGRKPAVSAETSLCPPDDNQMTIIFNAAMLNSLTLRRGMIISTNRRFPRKLAQT
jgi:hypothetical protein